MTDPDPELARAWRIAGAAAAGLAVAAPIAWLAPRTIGIGVAAAALIFAIASVGLSAGLVRRRAGFDLDFLVGALWLPAMFGLILPPLALILGAIRLRRETVGGYSTIKEGGGGTTYPKVTLRGEAKPFGATLIAIGVLWPVVVLGLIFG